jgi:hypothetical protein
MVKKNMSKQMQKVKKKNKYNMYVYKDYPRKKSQNRLYMYNNDT